MADYLKAAPVTQNLVNAGLVAGTTTTLTMPVATTCVIDGKFATQRAIISANTAFATAITNALDMNTGVALASLTSTSTTGSAAVVVFGVTSAGLLRVVQGPATPTDLGVTTTPGAFRLAPQFPGIPDDFCPIAYTIARTSPSVPTVTVGSSNWANNFTTFQNISTLPAAPQVA
jgi:hypothetical protein